MVNKLFGKKLGMTNYFLEDGGSVPRSEEHTSELQSH